MASVEQRETQSSGLATFSNTLEIFDTFKSAREDEKDSDEESFHLPMLDCDEESDTNNKDAPAADGQSDETEDEILNKFDTDAVDTTLEENILHETKEISEDSEIIKDIDNVESEMNSFNEPPQGITEAPAGEKPEEVTVPTESTGNNHYGENTEAMEDEEAIIDDKIEPETPQEEEEEKPSEELDNNDVEDVEEVKEVDGDQLQTEESAINSGNVDLDENKQPDEEQKVVDEEMKPLENDEVMDVDDVDNKEESVKEVVNKIEESVNDDVDNVNDDVDTGVDKVNDENTEMDVVNVIDTVEGDAVVDTVEESVSVSDKVENVAVSIEPDAVKPKEADAAAAAAATDDDNLQCEDLLDISVIRDVDEDNASAIAENLNSNDVPSSEKSDNDDPDYEKVDDDSEMDQEDEKDNIEFEESNSSNFGYQDIAELSVAEDSLRDDGDSAPKAPPEKPVVDEAKATDDGGNAVAKIVDHVDSECTSESNSDASRIDKGSTENHLKSQEEAIQNKRPLSTDVDDDLEVSPKKMRLSSSPVSEQPAVANKDDKIKTLVTFKDYMKTKKVSTKLTRSDLEQFCLQKICEAIIHKTDVGELHQTIKKQEQIIDGLRKDLQQLTKQTRDLDIVNKKLMTELRVQNGNKKPLVPLKITRSVGLQVKLNLGSETNVRRKQLIANTPNSPKVTTPTTPANRSRSITPANSSVVRQVASSPRKPIPSPQSTPILSQALQQQQQQNRQNPPVPVQKRTPVRHKTPEAPKPGVIDLTDEDDKASKNAATPFMPMNKIAPKNIVQAKQVPNKSMTSQTKTAQVKSMSKVLPTTRTVQPLPQGVRLTPTQVKNGIAIPTSMLNSTSGATTQLMYVVQPSSLVTSTAGGNQKALLLNFQPSNGVLTSTLNGSAVSVIPKSTNAVQLKTVLPRKHPAPLPIAPPTPTMSHKPLLPKPHLSIRKTDTGIILQWRMPYNLDMYEGIASYQLFAYQETNAPPNTDMWRKVGDVKALALPMACTLTQFADKNKYYFAVRSVDIHKRLGAFSDPEEISL